MDKLLLVDTKGTGHHRYYAELVLKAAKKKYGERVVFLADYEIENVKNINLEYKNHRNIFFRAFLRLFWFFNVLKIVKKRNISHIHFLYLDSIIIISPFAYILYKVNFFREMNLTATLHHLPIGKTKSLLFKLLSNLIDKIVVHGEYIKDKLNYMDIINIYNIEYPANHNYFPGKKYARKKLDIDQDKKILLSLGGTRRDKGLDILLTSLDLISDEDFLFVIAGKEEYFSKEFILEKVETYKEKTIIDLNYISNEKFSLYLEGADIIVLPYREDFLGQSGPLTEGVNHDCFIIASNHGQIGYTVKHNNIGFVFKVNNELDLSYKIKKVLNDNSIIFDILNNENYKSFKKEISINNFIKKYIEII